MSTSIGGSLETSILMDVSGVRLAARSADNELRSLEGSVARTSQAFRDSTADTTAANDALQRAAEMVELLSTKLLSYQIMLEKSRTAASTWSQTVSRGNEDVAQSTQTLTQAIMGGSLAASRAAAASKNAERNWSAGIDQDEQWKADQISLMGNERKLDEQDRRKELQGLQDDIQARSRMQQQWMSEQASMRSQERNLNEADRAQELRALRENIQMRYAMMSEWISDQAELLNQERKLHEAARERELADLREDIVKRSAEEQKAAEQRQRTARARDQRYYDDSRRFSAGATRVDPYVTRPGNISPSFSRIAREALTWERGRVAAHSMLDAIEDMRGALDPVVAMEQRLNREARQFTANMELAVRAQHLSNEQAEQLLHTYRQLTEQQIEQVRNQQRSFLGFRNFGFVAQQGAYAIEDFTQVFSTMGVAGGIRAAANNLTAMGATIGPTVGVMSSLGAAAAMVALHLWESRDASEELATQQESLLKLGEDREAVELRSLEISAQINQAKKAEFSELQSIYEKQLEDVQELYRIEESRVNAARALQTLNATNNELKAVELKIAEENAKWYERQFAVSLAIGRYFADAGSGVAGMFDSNEGVRLADEQFNIQARLDIEQQRQENNLKRLNSEEHKRVELLRAQIAILQEESRRLSGRMHLAGIADQSIQDDAIRIDKNKNDETRFKTLSTEVQLAARYVALLMERRNIEMMQIDLADAAQVRVLERAAEINDDLFKIEEARFRLAVAAKEAAEESRQSIVGQFESLNKTLAFENGILETQKKITEQIEIASRANRITPQQAEAARGELERVLDLQRQQFENETRLKELKEEESRLQLLLKTNPVPTTAGAIARGSSEDLRMLEENRLKRLNQSENKPVVDALLKVLTEIKGLRDDQKNLEKEEPEVAALVGF